MHPKKGAVLFDAGIGREHVPEEMKADISTSYCYSIPAHLKRLGLSADDVQHVVMSHLHFDHSGQMGEFKKAVFHIRKSELEAARTSDRCDYLQQDLEVLDDVSIEFVPEDVDYDLFGDGSVVCLDTKGHSAGHQSFLIDLPNSGKILLAVDAAHMRAFLTDDSLMNESWDKRSALRSVERLIEFEKGGARLIFGHDPDQWAGIKKAPDYYD